MPESSRIVWYRVIDGIITTNERLRRIRMVQTDTCSRCNRTDTLEYRITECGAGRAIWDHAKNLIAQMLRTTPDSIPDDWLINPQFRIRTPKCLEAILWMLAQVILFRTQQERTLAVQDFLVFLQRSRWKLSQSKKWRDAVGNYLSVMDPGMAGASAN